MYVSEFIEEEYKSWKHKVILLNAPTNAGKTTFIVNTYLPYLKDHGKRLLILCNRKLLRQQYWASLIRKYDSRSELDNDVTVSTYQAYAEKLPYVSNIFDLFSGYDAIVCDEAHYFYADSDFNSSGTYPLLQAVAMAGLGKTVIFMSATMWVVELLIKQTINNCLIKLRNKDGVNHKFYWNLEGPQTMKVPADPRYERFNCICVPDYETLCDRLARSDGKSILFIDNKDQGERLKEIFKKNGLSDDEVVLLNASILESDGHDETVTKLVFANRLNCKILITTSVLDNGVSIHDPELQNMCIVTESKLSFLQMIGRARIESVSECNLYFVKRPAEYFLKRRDRYEADLENFKKLERPYCHEVIPITSKMWENPSSDECKFMRKALVPMQHERFCYDPPRPGGIGRYGSWGFYVNEFAYQKIGDMALIEERFYGLAADDPLKVVYEQMEWIGKNPEELMIEESDYIKEREAEFRSRLLTVKDFTKDDLTDFKKSLVSEFRNDVLKDISTKNGTLSNEKLESICQMYGLEFITEQDDDRRNRYTINEINDNDSKKFT